jgi:hypothetical protein
MVAIKSSAPEGVAKCQLWVISGLCNAIGHVRFTLDSDREQGFQQMVMFAFPRKRTFAAQRRIFAKGRADIARFIQSPRPRVRSVMAACSARSPSKQKD